MRESPQAYSIFYLFQGTFQPNSIHQWCYNMGLYHLLPYPNKCYQTASMHRIPVSFVISISQLLWTLQDTKSHTCQIAHLNVTSVIKGFCRMCILKYIQGFTQENSHTSVRFVAKLTMMEAIWKNISKHMRKLFLTNDNHYYGRMRYEQTCIKMEQRPQIMLQL